LGQHAAKVRFEPKLSDTALRCNGSNAPKADMIAFTNGPERIFAADPYAAVQPGR
jgi:hypothetical protein